MRMSQSMNKKLILMMNNSNSSKSLIKRAQVKRWIRLMNQRQIKIIKWRLQKCSLNSLKEVDVLKWTLQTRNYQRKARVFCLHKDQTTMKSRGKSTNSRRRQSQFSSLKPWCAYSWNSKSSATRVTRLCTMDFGRTILSKSRLSILYCTSWGA